LKKLKRQAISTKYLLVPSRGHFLTLKALSHLLPPLFPYRLAVIGQLGYHMTDKKCKLISILKVTQTTRGRKIVSVSLSD
jgi:hypothetical protein